MAQITSGLAILSKKSRNVVESSRWCTNPLWRFGLLNTDVLDDEKSWWRGIRHRRRDLKRRATTSARPRKPGLDLCLVPVRNVQIVDCRSNSAMSAEGEDPRSA